jgi:hypothetical protein
MNKKLFSFCISLLAMLMVTGVSYTQNQPAADDAAAETVVTDEAIPAEADPIKKEDVIFASKQGAKAYFDGYNTFINTKVLFELSTSDNIFEDKVFYKLNDSEEIEYKAPFNIEEEGKTILKYYSVDKVGNVENKKDIYVVVDKTAPELAVTMSAPFAKQDGKIYVSETFIYTYSITAKDNLSGVANIQYSSDGDTFQEYIEPVKVSSAAGPVKMKVIAIDNVANSTDTYVSKLIDESGNVIDLDENVQFVVDKKAPTVIVKSDKEFVNKDGKNIASRDYKYTIEAADEESGVKEIFYRLNSRGDFIPYTGEIQLRTNGDNVIEAVAKDKVGNVSKTALLKVFVDIVPPASEIKMVNQN